ncbi:hypothetical protein FJV41_15160 [Myxococcus llanfairpwllgwyngyllgogerychwyrndrobwllllantysiliogogogochensis]|uniref:Uncharacterized protein n=1 Tax=Myxococcus llanfairpwllgwyngyllgogerychwyrndrobwllllantysiliogogogochensis TaxID=2590453 RepID=A0A540X1L2_9BACT|nr:hypothetical protein [Myxococcus llanfairpwllgwyngyllgogerychwyrndrobwllllantysiliogogogochensis]TQF15149.1 hypothetical protein FJV41_15160 [Myxococcus llanfairpwllgwyngyllgogerychwyrndrobwllllantysiliogogogochensis]
MSASSVVRQLLSTLEQSSLREEARSLRQQFDQRGWAGLGAPDIALVAALVGRLQTFPPAAVVTPVAPLPAAVALARDAPAQPEEVGWSPWENGSAWIDTIPRGRECLSLLDELARCDEADAALTLLSRLFVGHLRYEAHVVDETQRLDSTAVIRRLRTIARHGDFMVSLAELVFPYPHGSNFQPIFRRHPYGLVVAIAPGWNACQFAYREEKDGGTLVPRTRQMVGYARGGELRDTLLIWLRRMSLLRLTGGEEVVELVRRVESALGPDPVEVSRQWNPVALAPSLSTPPGVTWDRLLDHERRAFLQEDRGAPGQQPRLWWGLERVLRMALPFTLAHKQARLCYRGYDLEAPTSPEVASRSGKSWFRRLTLKLELVFDDGRALPLSLPVGVPEVDDQGRMLLDGLWYRWVPRVFGKGLLSAGDARVQEPSFDEGFEEEVEEESPIPEQGAAPEGAGPEPELESPLELLKEEGLAPSVLRASRDPVAIGSLAGGSLCAFLESATYRKLMGISMRLASYEDDAHELPRSLPALLRGVVGRDDRLLLVSKVFLKAVLEPAPGMTTPEELLPILRHAVATDAGTAPAWACPDVSADLRPGAWVPVEVARLTPGGDLSVPLRNATGVVRLGVSMESLPQVNPRAGGTGGLGTRGWIARGLSHFASLPAGRLRSAAQVALQARPLSEGLRVVSVHGPRLCARWTMEAPPPPESKVVRAREFSVRIPGLMQSEGVVAHRVLLSRGACVKAGDAWLEAERSLWAQLAGTRPRTTSLHEMNMWSLAANVFTFTPKKPTKDEAEEETILPLPSLKLPKAVERWFVPPGVHGQVLDIHEELERDKSGEGLAWRITLVVGTEAPSFPWSHLVLPDGRVLPFQEGLRREDAPYQEDGAPAQLVIEDPTLAAISPSDVWFDGVTGELLERATAHVGTCFVLPATRDVLVGPDLQLRFRARDGEGIPASAEAPALSAMERLWWTAARPEDSAKLAEVERAWAGDVPPFLPRLAEVLEAADIAPPDWMKTKSTRQPGKGRAAKLESLTMSRVRQWTTGYAKEDDAPVRWSCWCGRTHGRRRAFEPCEPGSWGCGTPVVLRPPTQERRALPALGLCEPVLHPWRMESAACLLGLTLPELKAQQVRVGAVVLGILMRQALRNGAPGAAGRKRLEGRLSAAEREALLRGLETLEHDVATGSADLVGRFFLSSLAVLPNTFHPTGLPPGAPGLVKSPLTEAYHRVRFASNRLVALRASGARLVIETARASFHEAVAALFGPMDQGMHRDEPTSLAGLITRLWPLTRAPGLRSVVPGLFRMEGSPVAAGFDGAFIERGVERLPHVHELLSRASPAEVRTETRVEEDPDSDDEGWDESPRDGIEVVRLRMAPTSPGVSTIGIFSSEQALFLPPLPSPACEPLSAEFWEGRAARERLLRLHLPRLMGLVGAFSTSDAEQVDAGRESPDAQRMPPGSVGTVALRELMGALVLRESRPLDLCRLLEARRPTPLVEDGARASVWVEERVRRAFPGEGAWLRTAHRLLARALAGWWKSRPREGAPSGWSWAPPDQKGAAGGRRFVPPLASVAWARWPGMEAATTPVRFLVAHAGLPVEGVWSPVLLRALGLEAGAVPMGTELPQTQPTLVVPVPPPGAAPVVSPHPEEILVATPLFVPPPIPPVGDVDEVSLLEVTMVAWLGDNTGLLPEVSLLSTSMDVWLKRGRVS